MPFLGKESRQRAAEVACNHFTEAKKAHDIICAQKLAWPTKMF